MKNDPDISVLMSCYNGQKWLGNAIESVLNQSFKDFEFIIVDDGSRDSSAEIMKSYAAKDSRIKIIEKENTGLPDSLNVGLNEAKGEWIARIDADDLCEPDRLEKQLAFSGANPSVILIGSAYHEMDETGKLGKLQTYPETHQQLKKHLLQKRRFFAHSSAFYKTEIARKVGFYRPRIKKSEDYDLWLRLSEVGKMACISEPLIRFRSHPDQISNEDAGRRQIADGRVALTSYWIRKYGYADPVEQNKEQFNQFRKWIVSNIKEEKLLEYREFVSRVKSQIAKRNYSYVLKSCLTSPWFVYRHLDFLIRGEGLSRRFAKKWIRSQKKMH